MVDGFSGGLARDVPCGARQSSGFVGHDRCASVPPWTHSPRAVGIMLAAAAMSRRRTAPRRQPAGQVAQERARTRGSPGHDRGHDRQARNGRRPRLSSIRRATSAGRLLGSASKVKALEALAEAAANRSLRPTKDLDKLVRLDPAGSVASGTRPREGGDPAGGPLEARGGGRCAQGTGGLAVG